MQNIEIGNKLQKLQTVQNNLQFELTFNTKHMMQIAKRIY